jgi:hypothetical protein
LAVGARQKEITRVSIPGKPTDVTVNDGSIPESDTENDTFKVPQ